MAGVLITFWLASRRPLDARVATALERVDERLAGLTERVETAAAARVIEPGSGLGAIGSTVELDEVMQRALAAASALPAVDAGAVRIARSDGTMTTATRGLETEPADLPAGPPDGSPFHAGLTSWQVDGPHGLRSSLVVPIGTTPPGSLAVFSRTADAFDAEAVSLLTTIARYATPAAVNAIRFLEVQELAATDQRTGVGSALAFEEALPREISTARRHGRPLSLIQVDLDDFGEINKTHSQEVGNEVLSEFGARVRATIRGSDAAFRNSGGADEFFLILPDTTREFARLLFARLAFAMTERPFGEIGVITMSGGLVELRDEDTPMSLQARSGELVREAKSVGKNRLLDDGPTADTPAPPV